MTVTLAEIEATLNGEPLVPAVAVALTLRVLELLEEAHAYGPYGSLSPETIWIDLEGRVALAPRRTPSDSDYRAPEQARGDMSDRRSDLFAAGQILRALIHGAGQVPGAVDSALQALTAPDPQNRPKTATEARHRLSASMPSALRIGWADIGQIASRAEALAETRAAAMIEAGPTNEALAVPHRPSIEPLHPRSDSKIIVVFALATVIISGLVAWILISAP